MQVFKAYFKILKMQFRPLMIYAGLFLFIMVAFIRNNNDGGSEYKTEKVSVMVINKDGESSLLKGFLDYLGQYVNYIEPVKEEREIQDALFYRKAAYILTIPKGFTEDFLAQGRPSMKKLTSPDTIEAITIDNAIDNYFNMARVYQSYLPDITAQELAQYVKTSLQEVTKVDMYQKTKVMHDEANSRNKSYFNYLGYIIIAIFITSVSTIMFSFRGLDIRRRHSASPLSDRSLNIQLLSANALFMFGYLILFLGYNLYQIGIMNINTILFWINALIFSVVVLSISYLIGISVSSKKAITALATALSLGLAFLSGMFVQQEYLGALVLKVASFTPAYWFVKANNTIETISSGAWSQLINVAGYMGIQLGFAAAIISIALVVSKRKTQQEC
jgi:ABC-2 type transport system permease protein